MNVKNLKLCFGLIILTAVFVSCSQKQNKDAVFDPAVDPQQTMTNATMFFSDSGILQMEIWGQEIQTFENEKKEQTQVFPSGIKAKFFDPDHRQNALVTANEAINHTNKKLLQAFGDVIIRDFRSGDTIYTEELFWDQEKRSIYSNKHVKRVSPTTGITEGDGFESDDQMERFRMKNPRGVIHIYD